MTRTLRRLAFAALFLLPVAAAPLAAQTPTAEGTVITNTASASFSDANSNTYSAVTATATVTVGFLAGPNPTALAATATPAAGSVGNTMTFTIKNSGNGRDSVSLGENAHAGVTVTNYAYNGVNYSTLAALNSALALTANALPAGSSGTLILTYSVAAGTGGTSIPVTITETSLRTPSAFASATTTVNPPASRSVAVTPDAATLSLLPKSTVYTQTFVITNNGNASDSYNIAAAVSSSVAGSVTINTVNGVAGTSTTTGVLAAGGTVSMDVTYTVNNTAGAPAVNVPAGTTAKIILTATSQASSAVSDPGDLTITVVRAAVTMTKVAYKDDQTTVIGASLVVPGQFLQYLITVTNGTGANAVAAQNIQVTDALPAEVTYQSATGDAAGWTISGTTTVTAQLAGTLATGASRFFWIRVKVK